MRTTEKQCYFAAWWACVAMRVPYFCTRLGDVSGYSREARKYLVTDMHDAWRKGAFVVERPFAGTSHRWRLCRFVKDSSAESDVSAVMTQGEFFYAMQAIRNMADSKRGHQ